VTKLVEAGKVSPRLDDHPFWLHDADTAHELVRSGQANGKVVITVSE
jgi:NADPH:quinone reductase-like Zn-dependent oxidoreductase